MSSDERISLRAGVSSAKLGTAMGAWTKRISGFEDVVEGDPSGHAFVCRFLYVLACVDFSELKGNNFEDTGSV